MDGRGPRHGRLVTAALTRIFHKIPGLPVRRALAPPMRARQRLRAIFGGKFKQEAHRGSRHAPSQPQPARLTYRKTHSIPASTATITAAAPSP